MHDTRNVRHYLRKVPVDDFIPNVHEASASHVLMTNHEVIYIPNTLIAALRIASI